MIKRLLVVSGVMMMFAACSSKDTTDSAVEAFKESLAKQNNACAEMTLVKTKAQISEANELRAAGNNSDAKIAEEAAMEAYKTEGLAFDTLNNSNEVQYSRMSEYAAKRSSIEPDAMMINEIKWAASAAIIDSNMEDAKVAYELCDPARAEAALDVVQAELEMWENLIAEAANSAVDATTGYNYVVKKGDNLWEIAGNEYKNPFMWPIIYWSNKQNIKDPDLIFPGQNFEIVFDYSDQEMRDAQNLAKTRGSWSLYDNK